MNLLTLVVSFFALGLTAVSAYPGSDMHVSHSLDARAWEQVEDRFGYPGSVSLRSLDAQAWEDVQEIFHKVDMWDEDDQDLFMRELAITHDAELEARGMGGIVDVAVDVAKVVFEKIAGTIQKKDDKKRSKYTQHLLEGLRAVNPSYYYIICHTKHEISFNGNKGTDWKADWRQSKQTLRRWNDPIDYDVYAVRRGGTFTRKGDGGWLNWAYSGGITSEDNGKHLIIPVNPLPARQDDPNALLKLTFT